jgi:hypothetical protein
VIAPAADRPLLVWCLVRDQLAHVRPVEACLGPRARFVYDDACDPERMLAHRPDVVVCVNDWPYDVTRCLDAARAARIPSLVVQDGILEWRCQYENPLFGAGGGAPQHQPVLADRIACLGRQSARHIAAWGNEGKVQATGMPRLDYLLDRPAVPRRRPGRRIVVMTAKNPGFTPEQRDVTLRSLRDVKAHLDTLPGLEVVWRIGSGLVPALGVQNQFRELEGAELVTIIESADAVITTPSTVMLEAMLLDRPVAALDYHNVPRFVPTAWTISAPEHVPGVIAELLDPSPRKLAFQRDCLEDCLECDGPAAPRVAALICEMALAARGASAPLAPAGGELPPLPARPAASARQRPAARLAEMYPEQPLFAEANLPALQVRLARLQKENERLKGRVRQQSVAYRLYSFGRSLAGRLNARRRGLGRA